jgi:hypothetical protein
MIKRTIAVLVMVIVLVGCKRYVMDEKAKRCRDTQNGQFVNSELCK